MTRLLTQLRQRNAWRPCRSRMRPRTRAVAEQPSWSKRRRARVSTRTGRKLRYLLTGEIEAPSARSVDRSSWPQPSLLLQGGHRSGQVRPGAPWLLSPERVAAPRESLISRRCWVFFRSTTRLALLSGEELMEELNGNGAFTDRRRAGPGSRRRYRPGASSTARTRARRRSRLRPQPTVRSPRRATTTTSRLNSAGTSWASRHPSRPAMPGVRDVNRTAGDPSSRDLREFYAKRPDTWHHQPAGYGLHTGLDQGEWHPAATADTY